MKPAANKLTAFSMDDSRSSANSPALTATAKPRDSETEAPPPSLLQAMRSWLKHALGQKQDSTLKEVLEEAIEVHEEQAEDRLAPEEKAMLHNVLSFSDTKVSDIMVPRTDIVAVPSDISLEKLKEHIMEQRHTRVPVYQETLDKILGFIHVKDLLPMLSGDRVYDIQALMRGLLFVPPSMRIIDLLVRMRHAGSHMAIVVDEYGGTDGLITMEDLFEEIVGDIQDEHDGDEDELDKIITVGPNIFEVNARISIEKLEQEFGVKLSAEDNAHEFDTLGGLIFFRLGHVPAKGETVEYEGGLRFEITDADPRRIRRVRIMTMDSNG